MVFNEAVCQLRRTAKPFLSILKMYVVCETIHTKPFIPHTKVTKIGGGFINHYFCVPFPYPVCFFGAVTHFGYPYNNLANAIAMQKKNPDPIAE